MPHIQETCWAESTWTDDSWALHTWVFYGATECEAWQITTAPQLVYCTTAPAIHGLYKEDDRLMLVPDMIVGHLSHLYEGL